jgi:hypothetical protein
LYRPRGNEFPYSLPWRPSPILLTLADDIRWLAMPHGKEKQRADGIGPRTQALLLDPAQHDAHHGPDDMQTTGGGKTMQQDNHDDEISLAEKLEAADRRIHIDSLKAVAARLNGGDLECWDNGDEQDTAIIEAFWENVVAFEKGPRRSLFAQLQEAGVALPPPDSLDEAQLHEKLWEVIHKLTELRTFLSRTDHLSDRELYTMLWDDILREEETVLTGGLNTACHIDILGEYSDEDMQISLRYYDDEMERAYWAAEYPDRPLPPHEELPYPRDHLLPQGFLG